MAAICGCIDAGAATVFEARCAGTASTRANFAASAFGATQTAVIEVAFEIEASFVAFCLARWTRGFARTIGTQLARCALGGAIAAIIAIRGHIATDPRTIDGGSITHTGSSVASFVSSAKIAASATVVVVALGIDTGTIAFLLCSWTSDHAGSAGTKLSRFALFVTNTAVTAIFVGIDTDSTTIRESCGAFTSSRCTFFAASAFRATGAAMVEIAFGIRTRVIAYGLTRRAGCLAVATDTQLARTAFGGTVAAEIQIVGCIATNSATIS